MNQHIGPGKILKQFRIDKWYKAIHLCTYANLVFIKKLVDDRRNGFPFPSDEDLTGAAMGLMRLQDTYKLDVHEISEGKLLGKKYSSPLTGTNYL